MAWDPNNRYIGTNPTIITVSNTPQPPVDERALRQQQARNSSVDQRSARQAEALRNAGNVGTSNFGSGAVRATTTAVPSNITPMINPYRPPQPTTNVNLLAGHTPVVTLPTPPCSNAQSNDNNRTVPTSVTVFPNTSGSGGPIVAFKAPATSNANNNNVRHP